MTRKQKGLIWSVAVIGVIVAAGLIAFRTQGERIARAVSNVATERFGRDRNIKIEIGDIGGSLFGDLRLKDVKVTYTGGAEPRVLLTSAAAYVRYDLASFLSGRIQIDSVEVISPRIVIPRTPAGTFIYPIGDVRPAAVGSASRKGRDVTIRRIRVIDSSVLLEINPPLMIKSAAIEAGFSKQGERSSVTIRNADLASGERTRIEKLSGVITALADRVEIRDLRLLAPSTSIGLAGFVGTGRNDSLAIDVAVDSLDLSQAAGFYGKAKLNGTGAVSGRARVSGRFKRLDLEAEVKGRFDIYSIDSLVFAGVYADSALTVEHLACVVNGAPFKLTGAVSLKAVPEYSGLVEFAKLDLSRFAKAKASNYSSDLGGRVAFKGRGFAKANLSLTAWPQLSAGRYLTWGFDSVAGRLSVTGDGVVLDTLLATIRDTRANMVGRIGTDGRGNLAFTVDCPRLDDLYSYHKVKDLRGEMAAKGSIQINGNDFAVSANSLGRGIDYAGAYLESLEVDLDLDRTGGHWNGWGSVLGSTMDLRGFKAGKLYGDVVVQDTTVKIQRLAVTRPTGDLLGARGEVRIHGKDIHVSIDDLEIQMGEYMWHNSDPIEVAYVGDSLAVSSFEIGSEMGKVSFANSAFASGRYRIAARVSDLDLGLLKQVLAKEIPTGVVSLSLDAWGTRDDLEFDLSFDVKHGEMRSVKFDTLSGSVGYSKGALAIKQISLDENGGNVSIEGALPVDLAPARISALSKAGRTAEIIDDLGRIAIKVRNVDISVLWPLAPPLAKLKGLAELELTVSGTRNNPRIATHGRLGGAYYGKTAVGDVTWDLVLEDSTFKVTSLALTKDKENILLEGEVPIAVSLLPFVSTFPARPMDLGIKAENGTLDLLCEIFPKLKVCSGTYGADLRIGGTVENPTFTGSANLAGATLRFEGVPQDVSGIYLDARAQGKRFEVTSMVAEKGALKAKGFFTIDSLKVSDWNFDLAMKDLAITEFEDFYVVVSGNITVKAVPIERVGVVPNIEGSVTVKEGEYYYSIVSGAGAGGGGEVIGPEAAPTWLMNVGVEIPQDFWVRGSDIDAELSGSLNVKKGSEGLLVLGTMHTLRGTFYIYNNDFKISRGEFQFADVKSLTNVYIDLEATSTVMDEEIDIAAKGKMENLDITATSASGWSETQIFEALTFRRGVQTEGTARSRFFSNEFLRSWGVALVNRFGSDVAKQLRLDQFGVEIGDMGQGSMLSSARVTFGKYVSDKLYLHYSQALGSLYGATGQLTQQGLAFPERQFQVEYRLSDKFSMDGEAGTVGGLGYFDADLKFTYGY